jgi:TalC/MipB family fructose-6-phosphate aldolase
MRIYLDTADIETVRRLTAWGAFAGVTTNPVILARAGLGSAEAVSVLCGAQPGDVFIQIDGDDPDEMERRVRELNAIVPARTMIKLPPTPAGLAVMHRLRDERIWTAATALFSLGQALLAASAGADVIIPFHHRIAERGHDADRVVRDMVELSARRGGKPKVLVASLKRVEDVLSVARIGAWGATIPPGLADDLIRNDGTAEVLARFAAASSGAVRETE